MATFKELKAKLWWSVNDGFNQDALEFLHSGNDGILINEALRDLAECLNIIKYDNTLTSDSNGLVTLPDDLRDVLRLKYDGTDLSPLLDVKLLYEYGGPTKYMLSGRTALQIYDAPTDDPPKIIELWYKAYPAKLVDDDDIPSDVPPEFHETLATVYARAQFHQKLGDYKQYMELMSLWVAIKKNILGIVEARTDLIANDAAVKKSWSW